MESNCSLPDREDKTVFCCELALPPPARIYHWRLTNTEEVLCLSRRFEAFLIVQKHLPNNPIGSLDPTKQTRCWFHGFYGKDVYGEQENVRYHWLLDKSKVPDFEQQCFNLIEHLIQELRQPHVTPG